MKENKRERVKLQVINTDASVFQFPLSSSTEAMDRALIHTAYHLHNSHVIFQSNGDTVSGVFGYKDNTYI